MVAVEWSTDVPRADWIGSRLAPFTAGHVVSVVPGGFAAYARVLHPASAGRDSHPLRWAEVASRNGLAMRPGVCFPEIALLPEENDAADPVLDVTGPREGTLDGASTTALVDVLRRHTRAPEDCWFCLWDGFGWERAPGPRLASWNDRAGAAPRARPRDLFVGQSAVPPSVLDGPRVRLPHREYLLYRGEAAGALAFVESERQTPNLWWPSDRAWCVATEIDLEWTYVGGSDELVDALQADPRLEAQRLEPTDSPRLELPAWLSDQIDVAAGRVAAGEEGEVTTQLGTVTVVLSRSGLFGGGELRTVHVRADGSGHGSGGHRLSRRDLPRLSDEVRVSLTHSLISLTA